MTTQEVISSLVSVASTLAGAGLSPGTTGNISARVPQGILVSPSGSSMGNLQDFALIASNGNHVSGPSPTKELPMHLAVYQHRNDLNAIVHLHSTYATLYSAISNIDIEDPIPAITPYLTMKAGRVGVIPYYRPGAVELGDAISKGVREGKTAFLMRNHGLVVAAKDVASASALAFELEESAKLAILARQLDLQLLTDAQRQELMPS